MDARNANVFYVFTRQAEIAETKESASWTGKRELDLMPRDHSYNVHISLVKQNNNKLLYILEFPQRIFHLELTTFFEGVYL